MVFKYKKTIAYRHNSNYFSYKMKHKNRLTLSTIVKKQQELLETSVDDETILMSIANSKYYGMDPVASRIWQLLNKPTSIQTIVATLLAEFEVSAVDCENDVVDFLESLMAENLIVFPNE